MDGQQGESYDSADFHLYCVESACALLDSSRRNLHLIGFDLRFLNPSTRGCSRAVTTVRSDRVSRDICRAPGCVVGRVGSSALHARRKLTRNGRVERTATRWGSAASGAHLLPRAVQGLLANCHRRDVRFPRGSVSGRPTCARARDLYLNYHIWTNAVSCLLHGGFC